MGGGRMMEERTIKDGWYRCIHEGFAAYSFGGVISVYKFEDGYKMGPNHHKYKFDQYYIFEVYRIHDPEYWVLLTEEEILIYKMAKES
jgi:hypothetical protein